tara:strand:+ start:97 stop:411 length:315 start_codon:yes stop_codon:yes gene_type:complete
MIKALIKVVDMYLDSEQKHYEENPSEDHVFHSLSRLSIWVKKKEKIEEVVEKRCNYRVIICINDLPNQTVEDMMLNAQGYIKDDIEMDNLYIEDIQKIKEWEEK